MLVSFSEKAWAQYLYWQETDRSILDKINGLIQECTRTPFKGTGKPEALKGDLRGFWSRRSQPRASVSISGGGRNAVHCRLPLSLRR